MTAAVICPPSYAAAIELAGGSKLFRKKLLPVGSIDYRGRKINFTRDYLGQLAGNFRARAYDQCPFQLAGADNKHNNDVRNFAGEVVDLDLAGDGLYAVVRATEDGARILEENPRLGVSARIVEDYARADGQFFPAAIQHVLGTLDPRLPGLGPWQSVDMSGDVDQVIDLSASDFGPDGDLADLAGLLHDLVPEPWELAELDQILAAQAEAQLDAELSADLDAIELAQGQALADAEADRLAQQAVQAQRLTAARAMARSMAAAAVQAGDFELGARTLIGLSRDAGGDHAIELAGDDGLSAARCGHDDGFGGCASRYHSTSCIAVGMAEAHAAGAFPPGLSGAGTAMRDRLESSSGVRLRPRESRFGWHDTRAADLPRSSAFPPSVRARAARIAAQAGMDIQSPDAARQRAIDRQVDAVASAALWGGNRARSLDDGPSFAQRREALRRPVSLQKFTDNGIPGAPSVPGYTAGRDTAGTGWRDQLGV